MSDYNDIKNKYFKYKKKYLDLKNESMVGSGYRDKVEKELPVNTPYGVALLELYKVGVVVNMFPHQVAVYMLHPQDGKGLSSTNDKTIYVSALPSFNKYTFKISKQTSPSGRISYNVTRLS